MGDFGVFLQLIMTPCAYNMINILVVLSKQLVGLLVAVTVSRYSL